MCLDNKHISHTGSNIWPMWKYVNAEQLITYIYSCQNRGIHIWTLSSNWYFMFLICVSFINKYIEGSYCLVLEFSKLVVWENLFTALHINCSTPETAFEYLSDHIFLPQPPIALWKSNLVLTPHSQVPFMKWIPSTSFLSQIFVFLCMKGQHYKWNISYHRNVEDFTAIPITSVSIYCMTCENWLLININFKSQLL